jgi:hypothetical protein
MVTIKKYFPHCSMLYVKHLASIILQLITDYLHYSFFLWGGVFHVAEIDYCIIEGCTNLAIKQIKTALK